MLKLNDWELEYLKKYNFDILNKDYNYINSISEYVLSDEIYYSEIDLELAGRLWHLVEKLITYINYLYDIENNNKF